MPAIRLFFTCFILMLSLSSSFGAQDSKEDKEDFETRKKGAEKGDPFHQWFLGTYYALRTPPNYEEAVKWFRKAADQGDATGQDSLGFSYFHGHGVPKDYAQAIKWFDKAAEQGCDSAQYHLGKMYAEGKGVPLNGTEAVKWYRKAAEQGHNDAQCHLGRMYLYGDGVPKDDVEAYVWLNLAAVFDQEAKELRNEIKLTPEEKARAQKRSTELFSEIKARKKAAGK